MQRKILHVYVDARGHYRELLECGHARLSDSDQVTSFLEGVAHNAWCSPCARGDRPWWQRQVPWDGRAIAVEVSC